MNTTILKGTYGYTKNQNQYKKSNIGKTIGTITGIGVFTPVANYTMKDVFKEVPAKFKLPIMGIIVAAYTGLFRLLGEGVDAIINKIRENKTDKEAQKALQNQK